MITEKSIRESIEASGVNLSKEGGFIRVKDADDTITSPSPGEIQYAGRDGGAPRPLRVRDLIPTVQATGGSIGYFTTTREGSPAYVAEDGAKPQMSFSSQLVTRPLVNFAGIAKVTEECASDYPTLVDRFQNDADDALYDLIDIQIVAGNGSSGQLYGLNSAIPGAGDELGEAFSSLLAAGYTPDGIILSRRAFATLIHTSQFIMQADIVVTNGSTFMDSSQAHIYPNSMYDANVATGYKNLISFSPLRIMGLPVAIMPVATGLPDVIIGDFRHAARLYATGIERQIGRDDNDFSRDRLTLRSSERVALAVLDAGALRKAGIIPVAS